MSRHASLPLWDDQSSRQQRETLRGWLNELYRYSFAAAADAMRQRLTQHTPADGQEAANIALILHLMDLHPMLFSPLCEPCHFTGSALVMDGQGRIVLHYHKKLGRWLQFGGHPELETDMADVALREAREESGLPDLRFWGDDRRLIDVDVHTIPATSSRPQHLHLDLRYVLQTEQPALVNPMNGESVRLQWFRQDELLSDALQLDPAHRRLIQKAIRLFQEQQH